jgi:cysteine-rich repeat protein
VCGDGIVGPGEDCDDGNDINGDACLITCVANVCGDGILNPDAEACDDGNRIPGDGCENDCRITVDSGCSDLATWEYEIAPDFWICTYNVSRSKTWPQTYGVCNEAGGFYLPTVGPMTRRGLPTDAQINAAMTAARARGHDYITTGHPARSCSWNSAATSYESCNGLGYVSTGETDRSGSNWRALTDGNTSDYRSWPSANTTGAHPLASFCLNASSDPAADVFDHRWR